MRYLFTFLFVFLSFIFLSAEDRGGCGTVPPASYQHSSTQQERLNYISNSSSRSAIRWVGVLYHIITKDDGSGGGSLKNIFDNHCELNAEYNDFNIGFYIAGFDTIKSTTLWNYQTSLGYQTFRDHNEANVCNIYVNGNLPGLCGFATYPSGSSNKQGGIFLYKGCVGAGDQTLAHEMGHYLNLPHTFDDFLGIEFVNGSNCSTAGDGFCDTPADFLDDRTPCPYLGPETDPNGDFYRDVIDETLIMSYFSDACVNRFSNEEQAEMNSALTNKRSYLLTPPVPDITPLDPVVFIHPLNGDTTLLSPIVQFKWHSVPRAQFYRLLVQSATSSIVILDTLIKDTTYTVSGLAANKGYKFRVRPISYGNTCGDNSPFQFVQTAIIKTTVNVAAPTCPGKDDGTVTVTASNGAAPYTYLWSNGAIGDVVTGIAAGTYTVTITDINGKVAVASLSVGEPEPLLVDIIKVGNNLTAMGTGGTPGYSYTWSNGVSGPGNNNIVMGNYTVTMTDSKGCLSTQSFILSDVGINLETKVSMKIFPNPASNVAAINLQLTLNETTEASVSLINVTGEMVQYIEKEFSSGVNNVPMNVEQLASGIYFIQFKTNEITKTERVSVIK